MGLHWIAMASLTFAVLSAMVIAADIPGGHRQKIWITDVVWPVTGLYAGPLTLCAAADAPSAAWPRDRSRVLVHDAGRYARGLSSLLPDEPVAHLQRHQGKHVSIRAVATEKPRTFRPGAFPNHL